MHHGNHVALAFDRAEQGELGAGEAGGDLDPMHDEVGDDILGHRRKRNHQQHQHQETDAQHQRRTKTVTIA